MKACGVIGLGVMGKNLILNLVDHGYTVYVYNRTKSKIQEIEKYSSKIRGCENLQEFAGSIPGTKIIILEVKAGDVVDAYLKELNGLLGSQDIVIDCGNSDYKDTLKRYSSCLFNFVGCGVSGGEIGARLGPSLMVGCKREVYEVIRPLMEDLSAKFNNIPCCGYLGDNGAGHFVKMIHNGIEYCEMELLQEVYNIIQAESMEKDDFDIQKSLESKNAEAQSLFSDWNTGRLEGYLIDICSKILTKKDNNGFIVDQILDKAQQKGTGKMCIHAGVETGVEINAMSESVFARFLSNKKEERCEFAQKIGRIKKVKCNEALDHETLEKAFYFCRIIAFFQGFNVLREKKKEHNWVYSISDLCRTWRNGCIIRCKMLDDFNNLNFDETLTCTDFFVKAYDECYGSLKKICEHSIKNEIYLPVFNSCLMWVNGLKMSDKNGNLIQAMRDYFGRHGVVLKSNEHKNVEWD